MFAIDDQTGNVMTTAAVFVITAAILYLARGVVFILLLSLLFAYLLEPVVTFIQRHSRLGGNSRSWAIAQMYLAGFLVLGGPGIRIRSASRQANEEPECRPSPTIGGTLRR